jgi:methylmalonyl-CoA mutase N-terminal domain/subunit
VKALSLRRAARDDAEVRARRATLVDVARGDGYLVEPMLQAVRAESTLGEICGALLEVWGCYREPARF